MENKNVRQSLESEILSVIKDLGSMELGSDDYNKTVEGLTKLLSKYNDTIKLETDYYDLIERIEAAQKEHDLKVKEYKSERNDRIVKNVLTAVKIGGGFVILVWGTKATFEFEREGTVTTPVGRSFINEITNFLRNSWSH